jgi:SAM-dependent methyltransferase
LRFAQEDYRNCLFAIVAPGSHWLDLGCGHVLLPEWEAQREAQLVARAGRLVGVDPELAALRRHRGITLRVCGDGGRLPFADGTFDLVTANMVVEHLPEPERQFLEIARVLRPGGRFVFHTPNRTGYPTLMARMVPDTVRALGARIVERRGEGERFPTFYRSNSPVQIERIAACSGFAVVRLDVVRSTPIFPLVTPLAAVELLLLRALSAPRLRWLRPNLIAVLEKKCVVTTSTTGLDTCQQPATASR